MTKASGATAWGSIREQPGCARLDCLVPAELVGEHFGTLIQSIPAEALRGRRVRLSAELSGSGVDRGVIWLRADGAAGEVLAFDNLMARPVAGALSGAFDWTARSIELDIPVAAARLVFGPLLQGAGTLWARGFRIEAMGDEAGDSRAFPFAQALSDGPRRS